MSKGITEKTLIEIVIGLLVVILLAPMLIRTVGGVWDKILDELGIVETPLFEKALLCSYYRCEKGASVYDTEEACKEFNVLGTPIEKDKICNFLSFQFPVEVEIKQEETISKERIAKQMGTSGLDCIVTERTTSFSSVTPSAEGLTSYFYTPKTLPNSNILYLFNKFVSDLKQDKTCKFEELDPAFSEAKIKPGKYYIATYFTTRTLAYSSPYARQVSERAYFVLDEKPYIELKNNENQNFVNKSIRFTTGTGAGNYPYRIFLPDEMIKDYVFYAYKAGSGVKTTIQTGVNIDQEMSIPINDVGIYNTKRNKYITFLVLDPGNIINFYYSSSQPTKYFDVKRVPTNGDEWTEQTQYLNNWGPAYKELDSVNKVVGKNSIKADGKFLQQGMQGYYYVDFTLPTDINVKPSEYRYLNFHLKGSSQVGINPYVSIKFRGVGDLCWAASLGDDENFNRYVIDLDKCGQNDKEVDYIRFIGYKTFWIDGLHFFDSEYVVWVLGVYPEGAGKFCLELNKKETCTTNSAIFYLKKGQVVKLTATAEASSGYTFDSLGNKPLGIIFKGRSAETRVENSGVIFAYFIRN